MFQESPRTEAKMKRTENTAADESECTTNSSPKNQHDCIHITCLEPCTV